MATVLLLGDITGRSRVALRMQTAVLEAKGHEVLALPTALISNTLNLGRHCAMDTTQYLLDSLRVWEELGLSYDLLSVGYVTGEAQAAALCGVMRGARARGVYTMVDPILGDGGRRYNSVTAGQEAGMRMLMEEADLITPNLTEACLLSGVPYEEAAQGGAALDAAIDLLTGGRRSVLVTGCYTGDGGRAVCGMDTAAGARIRLPYEKIPGHHWGTGDLYSAALMDALLSGCGLKEAAAHAADAVTRELLRGGEGLLPQA
ncbi:MAG: bifunctional hydroxymethylpyrimidine kinase/phosphomethylpyrimidine kinase [Clostridia bacterium]|nr:bifunctional hydroxymethylpyrimidine kinase/phosphomethylpyrimidine kinase [Clostridia bacterium]